MDDAFGFALTWNYWFNDAVSTASDLVALQIVLQYWTESDNFPGWAFSLIFWAVLIGLNLFAVKVYGEVCVAHPPRIISPLILFPLGRVLDERAQGDHYHCEWALSSDLAESASVDCGNRSSSSWALSSTAAETNLATISAARTGIFQMRRSLEGSGDSLQSL